MPNLILLFSHTLTEDQIQDAWRTLGVQNFISLPEDLQELWSNVPPDVESIHSHIQPIFDYLLDVAKPGDYLLVQGDFGAVYLAVNFALKHSWVPIYATTERKAVETPLSDGTVKTQRVFRHVRYRRYEG